MPNYTFRHTETGEEITVQLKMAEYDQFLADHPLHSRVYNSAPFYGDPILQGQGKKLLSEGYRDVLREMKKKNRNALSGGTPGIDPW